MWLNSQRLCIVAFLLKNHNLARSFVVYLILQKNDRTLIIFSN